MCEPLLATTKTIDPKDEKQLVIVRGHLPLFGSFKFDGIRAWELDGSLRSRTNKPLPNRFMQEHFTSLRAAAGLDGEMILGDPTDPLCYNKTESAVMRRDGSPQLTWHVFDMPHETMPFEARLDAMRKRLRTPRPSTSTIQMVEQVLCKSWDDVLEYESYAHELGHEGIILRRPDGRYKQGRATLREGLALKFKRMEHSEAVILGMAELQHNLNEQTISPTGALKRSSHKAGKIGGGTLGALQVRDIHTGVEFEIGTFKGFDAEWKQWMWDHRKAIIADKTIVAYKYFAVGVKDKPRHPVFKGFRKEMDL
jgi:DNA ligase-1